MKPHPDFADLALPRTFDLPSFRLTPLDPAVAEEDYGVVMESSEVLSGIFGGTWPNGLTLEDNRVDMGWHEREFTARRSFSWVVRDKSGTYVGCAYIFPLIGERGVADAVTWVRAHPNRRETGASLVEEFKQWCVESLPKNVALLWKTSP